MCAFHQPLEDLKKGIATLKVGAEVTSGDHLIMSRRLYLRFRTVLVIGSW